MAFRMIMSFILIGTCAASLISSFHLLWATGMYDKHLIIVYFPYSVTHCSWIQLTVP